MPVIINVASHSHQSCGWKNGKRNSQPSTEWSYTESSKKERATQDIPEAWNYNKDITGVKL